MRFHTALIVGATLWCGTAAAAEPGDWRAPWKVTLIARPVDAIPAELVVRMQNLGLTALMGQNFVFNLYKDDSLYGWALDPVLQAERLWIPPGATIERISKRQNLEFRDFKGNEIPQSQVDKDLADGKWRIVASLIDEATPKPERESSHLIWSSAIRFGRGR